MRRVSQLAAGLATLVAAQAARAADLLGQPTPGGIDLQPAAAPLKHSAIFFHDAILMPIISAITLLVLGLLIYVIIRFNKRANPAPARWSHNTPVEILWTTIPVLILMFIAVFSFRLLYAYHDVPKPDLTVKVTGNQWYWTYQYPDQGGFSFDSNVLPQAKALAADKPYLLGVDNPMVVPVGKVVRLLITGADVIHSFGLPAFGLKTDAIPGRVNETWFQAERPGIYYGQCSQLCGVDHAFMPIEIDVVDPAKFAAWVAGHGGGKPLPAPSLTPAQAQTGQGGPAANQAPMGPIQGAPPSPPPAGKPPAAQTTRGTSAAAPAGAPTSAANPSGATASAANPSASTTTARPRR